MEQFIINFNELPPSTNNYLKPSAVVKGGKAFVHLYETQQAKDFKKRFKAYATREIKRQGWDKEITSEGHFYLDCVFYQSRTNEDSNNFFKILCDALKDSGVIIDDKNLLVRTQMVFYDSKNPHFQAVLHRVGYKGIFKNQETEDSFIADNCSGCKRFNRNCSILKKAREGRIQDEIKFNKCEKRG